MKTRFALIGLLAVLFLSFYLVAGMNKEPGITKSTPSTDGIGQVSTPEKQSTSRELTFPLSLPDNLEVGIFAQGLQSPRDLEFSKDGTLLTSLTSKGDIVALIDANNDGASDRSVVILSGLQRPHGLAFSEDYLFVAEETKVSRYIWDEKNLTAISGKKILDLPSGGRHFTRSLVFDDSGKLYISLGSSCDVCFEKHGWLASAIVTDKDGINPSVFAKGLRNSVFLTRNPKTGNIWATEMGRDFLGDDAPPDEINVLTNGGDFGWPICYGDKTHDKTFDKKTYKQNPCNLTLSPAHQIAPHSAPLGLTFINSEQFPSDWQGDLLVSYHGSWNSSTPVGYKVVHLDIEDNKVVGEDDFLTGFLSGSSVKGRPVDLTFDKSGSLYISDDKSGLIYKVVRK